MRLSAENLFHLVLSNLDKWTKDRWFKKENPFSARKSKLSSDAAAGETGRLLLG